MQRRNTQFDSILKRGLDARREAGASGCPDEATLAAYFDRSLSASLAARWEEHFSNCARCQAMLAAMARAQAAQDTAPARPVGRRWELYAAIAAAVVGISVAVGLMRRGANPLYPAAHLASNELAASAPIRSEPQSKAAEGGAQIALNEPANREAESIAAPRNAPAQTGPGAGEVVPRLKRMEERHPLGRVTTEGAFRSRTGSREPEKRAQADVENTAPAAENAPSPGLAAPPYAPPEMAKREFAPRLAAGAPAGTAIGGTAGALVQAPAAAPMPGRGFASGMVSVRTADNTERWRLGAEGAIEHREPDGSWQHQNSGVTSALRAGAAPSPTTCWIVGAGGTILRTTDGEHWQKMNSPTAEDLVAVFAVDASAATVTAIDGSRFYTADGGRTWRPL